MTAMKTLYQDIIEGRITKQEAELKLGCELPNIEYTPDQIEVLDAIGKETDEFYKNHLDEIAEDMIPDEESKTELAFRMYEQGLNNF